MKPREDGGGKCPLLVCATIPDSLIVVDSHLNVYGVKNLKVTDVSLHPYAASLH